MPARNLLVFVVDLLVGPRDAELRPSRGCPTDIDDTERAVAAEGFGVAVERADGRVLVNAVLQTADRGTVDARPFGDSQTLAIFANHEHKTAFFGDGANGSGWLQRRRRIKGRTQDAGLRG